MEFNKTEKKFLINLLKKRIAQSERLIKHSAFNLSLPSSYNQEDYEKHLKKQNNIIKRSISLLEKIEKE